MRAAAPDAHVHTHAHVHAHSLKWGGRFQQPIRVSGAAQVLNSPGVTWFVQEAGMMSSVTVARKPWCSWYDVIPVVMKAFLLSGFSGAGGARPASWLAC